LLSNNFNPHQFFIFSVILVAVECMPAHAFTHPADLPYVPEDVDFDGADGD